VLAVDPESAVSFGHRQTKADRRNLTNSSLPILIRAVRVIEAKVTRSESRLVN
jgi:hypothetical protein